MESICEGCGKAFFCEIDRPTQPCWCASKPICRIDPNKKTCLCETCLAARTARFGAFRCFRLFLAYDGSGFSGFQEQANAKTVQGELSAALLTITGQAIRITAAGRTDAGVHARGQAVSIRFYTRLSSRQLTLALAAKLPKTLSVWRIDEMPLCFDARRQSVGKRYVYRIHQGLVPDPFLRRDSLFLRSALDIEAMDEAAKHFLGERDFSAFRSAQCTAEHALRYVWWAGVKRLGPLIEIDIRGNAFCLNMVRIMAGTLIEVGQGRRSLESIERTIASRDRSLAGVTAKPHGLSLEMVYYPDDLSEAGIPEGATFPRYPVSEEHWGIAREEIIYGPARKEC